MSKSSPSETAKMTSNEKYRLLRNYQAYQQSVFVFILLNFCSIKFSKATKRSSSTRQFLVIKELLFDNETIDVVSFIEKRCEEKMLIEEKRCVSKKTAQRRIDNYKFTENLHYLLDILQQFGYFYNFRSSQGKNGIEKSDTALELFRYNRIIFNQQEIALYGSAVNEYICSLLNGKYEITINKNDTELMNLCNKAVL